MIALGGIAAGIIVVGSIIGGQHFEGGGMGPGQDAHAYWLAIRGAPYEANAGTYGAYLYSPAFVQVLSPVLALAWPQFLALWTVLLMGAMLVLAGPVVFALMLPLAFFELWGGNIHLLLALAIVIGFRHPSAWAFVLLTKVTPGIGLLWFAVRGEWKRLGIALGATALVIGLSWLIDPAGWAAWLEFLGRQAGSPAPAGSIAIPIGLRLPLAAIVIVVAAVTDRRWLVPVGALLAMPVLWWGGLSVLIAIAALERERIEELVINNLRSAFDLSRTPRPATLVPEPEA